MKRTWAWIQPSGLKWTVETDIDNGTITLFNQDNKVILEQKALKAESIKIIEDNFMDIVAEESDDRLIHHESKSDALESAINYKKIYDGMMYA